MNTKPFYTSKIFWMGILETIIGVAEIVRVAVDAGDWSVIGIIALVTGVATLISRIWFTNTTLTR